MTKQKINNSKPNDRWIILAIVVVVIIIVLYAISLGKINLLDLEDEKTRRIRWIDKRLKNLYYRAKTKEELKRKLNRKVRQYFLYSRIILAALYLVANVCAFIWLTTLGGTFGDRLSVLLNYNEVVLISFLIVLFIRFEKPSEFRDVFRLVHVLIARIVYRNHNELDGEIENINKEVSTLRKERDNLIDNTNAAGAFEFGQPNSSDHGQALLNGLRTVQFRMR